MILRMLVVIIFTPITLEAVHVESSINRSLFYIKPGVIIFTPISLEAAHGAVLEVAVLALNACSLRHIIKVLTAEWKCTQLW